MAKKIGNTQRTIIIILVVSVIAYIIYAIRENNSTKEGTDWHNFEWGGSQGNGSQVLICCTKNIQEMLKIGDKVEIKVEGCPETLSSILQNTNSICKTKMCVCRGDMNGIHQVVGFGDDASSSHSTNGFRIAFNWQSNSSPTPSIANGKWRKVSNMNWW